MLDKGICQLVPESPRPRTRLVVARCPAECGQGCEVDLGAWNVESLALIVPRPPGLCVRRLVGGCPSKL